MNTDMVWRPEVLSDASGELASVCLARPSTTSSSVAGNRRSGAGGTPSDLLLLTSGDEDADRQLEHVQSELGELGVSPILWDGVPGLLSSPASFRQAVTLRGFRWGSRYGVPGRSKRGIVLGGGASLRDKLALKAGIEAVIGVPGLIAFYVADDAEGDSSYIGADGDLALFGPIASLRGTGANHAVNQFSPASIQIEQSSGILEISALAADIAVAIARVLHALRPAVAPAG